jgi:hypothetical protein
MARRLATDGLTLIRAGLAALEAREDDANRLNVFPVPDGDTGTNMVLTMRAVVAECLKAPTDDRAALAKAATDGSLMGARGNSGVILSQIIRGLCDVLGPGGDLDAPLVAEALDAASRVAMQAIRKPVAGTMLTVIEDTAKAAVDLLARGLDLDIYLESLLREAWRSVERTPELLPVLKEAGVVDAGGFGLAVLAEGMVRAMRGEEVEGHDELVTTPQQLSAETEAEELEYTYCTEFLVTGSPPPVAEVREFLEDVGGSILAVGDEQLLKVHVHTNDPGKVLSWLAPTGTFSEVHISNMEEQTSERRHALEQAGPAKPLGVVTVVAGDGLAEIMKSLGADVVVAGGQSMNPSIGEISDGVRAVHAETVIVLPNNKNVLGAAEQAAKALDEPRVLVVPTRTVPEGLAAMIGYDPEGEPEAVVREMEEEVGRVVSGAVTVAVRDSKAPAGRIKVGDTIGVTDSEIRVIGDDVSKVALELIVGLAAEADGAETVTLLAGEDLDDGTAEALADAVRERLPDMEVEWHRGGQPLYPLLVGIE